MYFTEWSVQNCYWKLGYWYCKLCLIRSQKRDLIQKSKNNILHLHYDRWWSIDFEHQWQVKTIIHAVASFMVNEGNFKQNPSVWSQLPLFHRTKPYSGNTVIWNTFRTYDTDIRELFPLSFVWFKFASQFVHLLHFILWKCAYRTSWFFKFVDDCSPFCRSNIVAYGFLETILKASSKSINIRCSSVFSIICFNENVM